MDDLSLRGGGSAIVGDLCTRDVTEPRLRACERRVRGMKTLGMDVQRGTHVPLTMHRSRLAVNDRNFSMADDASVVTILNRALNIWMPDDENVAERIWSWVAKGIREKLRWSPLYLMAERREWGQAQSTSPGTQLSTYKLSASFSWDSSGKTSGFGVARWQAWMRMGDGETMMRALPPKIGESGGGSRLAQMVTVVGLEIAKVCHALQPK